MIYFNLFFTLFLGADVEYFGFIESFELGLLISAVLAHAADYIDPTSSTNIKYNTKEEAYKKH